MIKRVDDVAFVVLLCFAMQQSLHAEDDAVDPGKTADQAPIILVVGAPGTVEYGEQFAAWASKWEQVGKNSHVPFVAIGRGAEGKPNDREQLKSAIESVSTSGVSPLWIVMIGHGTFARGVAKFNLRGPDVSAAEMADWVKPIKRGVVIVNCASSSGPFVNRLSAKRRIVVTATKSGNEQNYSRFGEYFANAIASPDSDLDHDDEVSVQEAFLRASAEVRQFYESEARIATEHALLDDNGDAKGTPASMFRGTQAIAKAKDGAKLDGSIASRVTLSPAGARLPLTAEELKQRDAIETELEKLRTKKSEWSEREYDAKIGPLMLRLARIYQAAEKRAASVR